MARGGAKGYRGVVGALYREEPYHTERVWQKLYRALHAHGLTGAVRGGVISAIDIALWDIKAKNMGVPIYDLLGGPINRKIRIYGHADTVKEARALVEKGYTAFKCKPDVALLAELGRYLAASRSVCTAMVSFRPQRRSRCLRTSAHKPMFLEELTNPDDLRQ